MGDRSRASQVGLAFLVYVVGFVVATALLLGFGQLAGATSLEAVAFAVVLAFPASVGASGAEVVL